MLALAAAVALACLVSCGCSLSEAVLYSVSWSSIEQLRKSGRKSGETLYALRQDVEKPITAILTLNTAAATAGSSIAGALAVSAFGEQYLAWFILVFTLLILIIGEIVPKTLGVVYNKQLAPYMAKPLMAAVWVLSPVIWLCGLLIRFIGQQKKGPDTTEDDIRCVVSLTRKAGIIKPYEELAIRNILSLDRKMVKEIMTPRTVVFSLPAAITVAEARQRCEVWPSSRVPVYDGDDPEDIVGMVYRRQILEALASDRDEARLMDLMRPVHFVLETLTLDQLLATFLESRVHLFVVLDEYGGLAGVVSLEDVLEEILGKEIVDETDRVVDMRALARQQRKRLVGERK